MIFLIMVVIILVVIVIIVNLRPAAAGVAKLAARDAQLRVQMLLFYSKCMCTLLGITPPHGSEDFCKVLGKANSHTVQLWQPHKL